MTEPLRQFVRTGSRSKGSVPGPGDMPAIPLPPEMGGDNELQGTERERETSRLRIPASQSEGCFCNGNGCSGSTCASMNGCVCNSSGTCWGAACSARVPTASVSPVAGQINTITPGLSQLITSPQVVSASPGIQQVLSSLSPLNAVRNALVTQSGQPMVQLPPGNSVTQANDCTCNQNGCSGNGCSSLNGCFCVGQSCWGNSCQNSIFNQPIRQQLQQQQAGNFIDIPDLFGGGGGGGGMNVEGQIIPVVQGLPVKRLNGQRARRIKGIKGRRGMGGMAASGRVRTRLRPQQLRKRSKAGMTSGAPQSDWAAEPIFKPVKINGVPTMLRFSKRKNFDQSNDSSDDSDASEGRPHDVDDLSDESQESITSWRKTQEKISFSPVTRDETDQSNDVSDDEGERRQSIEDEPLIFSEDVLRVNIMELGD